MDNSFYKILLVDDEPDILEFLSYNLVKYGYNVFTAQNGKEAIDAAKKHNPHLIILDVMMPDMDGIEACSSIREIPELENVIIAFLTARGEDYSQIAGFEAGGDDYITKPIKPKVFVSRVKALLKRSIYVGENEETGKSILEYKDITIDKEKYLVTHSDKTITLPKKEFNLLVLLASQPSKVFTRDDIYEKVWGDDIVVGDRTIDVHIRKLREKLGKGYIKTIKGVGYKFEV